MERRKLLLSLGSIATTAAVAGCTNTSSTTTSTSPTSNPSSCIPSDINHPRDLLPPSDSGDFEGIRSTSGGLDIGTETYILARYEGPDGNQIDIIIAEYQSQEGARQGQQSIRSMSTRPVTGTFIADGYVVAVDAQSRSKARALLRESRINNNCISMLSFDSSSPASETATVTETSTATATPTATPTPEPVVAEFRDTWEDGNLADPLWEAGQNVTVVEESAPDGGNHSLQMESSATRVNANVANGVRWDAPWTVNGLFKIDVGGDEPRGYRVAHNVKMVNGAVRMRVRGPSSSNQIVEAKLNGGLVSNTSSKAVAWERGAWYRYTVRHGGDGTYRLKFWSAAESEPSSFDRVTSGSPPSSQERLPLGYFVYSGPTQRVSHAFVDYRTDAAAEQ